jgi:phosphoglycerol transferase MdoB-like AlkP superfamily enzyme
MCLIYFVPFSYRAYKIIDGIDDACLGEIWIIDRLGLIGNDLLDLLVARDEKSIMVNFKYGNEVEVRNKNLNQTSNIICIQVETLDSNIIDTMYENQYICPFLHQLSLNCVYYPYMLFYRFAGASGDTDFTILNGILPLSNFPTYKLRNYSYSNSLVIPMIKSKYDAIAFHNNTGNYFNRKEAFFKMGFQDFPDIDDMHLKEKGWGAPDHEMFNFVKEKLKKQKTPFFYYIITMSSHEPFMTTQDYYKEQSFSDIKDPKIRGYFNSFSYVDYVLFDFVKFVRSHFKNTYIFIYGDHNAYAFRHHPRFSPKNLGVPLFIITPDRTIYRENKEIASVLDLSQTILYASGVNFKIMTQGANLLDFPIKKGPIPVNAGLSYDRETLFGKDITSLIDNDKQKWNKTL